ncbi:phosphoribosylanthranilate isomerase [Candidatus Methylacidiphilum infernorum]|uniref:N-(5'-phosphoribosyl)anthranilate isomerase n=1 Tax=Candidatus Methylacidiphilum infernorum TaxID=511746 RepID=A0ABX7PY04_9BACT|nr:phosphoribosylanthranilate isomerase [Candidatus Methylacidiphilum infernorum]QSR87474.1 phosphoribosylanthranilate isomerase [Candidatus Methylacidiphilum infernorum]
MKSLGQGGCHSKIWVKICGITSYEDGQLAIEHGADALGFVFYPKSPRYLPLAQASNLLSRFNVLKVAVVVNPSLEEIEVLKRELPIDLWQLHGEESPELGQVLPQGKIIKALRPPFEIKAKEWSQCTFAFLLDSPSEKWGGTGKAFDWKEACLFSRRYSYPFILAGGLNPDNIQKALYEVGPFGVDVSSGIETYPGKKDKKKLIDFIEKCKKLDSLRR